MVHTGTGETRVSDKYPQQKQGLKKGMTRRGLLFGVVNRFRGQEEEGRTLESLNSRELEADKLASAGEYEQAVAAYRAMLMENPALDGLRAKLGRCLYLKGQYLLARVECNRVLRKRDSRLARLYLGLVHAREGNLERALEAWESYFNPDAPEVMREINVIKALAETGKAQSGPEAAEAVERALGLG